jgi:hypothetical protein
VIRAGGFGSRLSEETAWRPNSLVLRRQLATNERCHTAHLLQESFDQLRDFLKARWACRSSST